jgi:hypothetical protein
VGKWRRISGAGLCEVQNTATAVRETVCEERDTTAAGEETTTKPGASSSGTRKGKTGAWCERTMNGPTAASPKRTAIQVMPFVLMIRNISSRNRANTIPPGTTPQAARNIIFNYVRDWKIVLMNV